MYLTQAYLDRELARPSGQQNFEMVLQAYERARQLQQGSDRHSAVTLIKFAALTRQLENLSLLEGN